MIILRKSYDVFSVRTMIPDNTIPQTWGYGYDTTWRHHTTSWDRPSYDIIMMLQHVGRTIGTAWRQCLTVSGGCGKEGRQLSSNVHWVGERTAKYLARHTALH